MNLSANAVSETACVNCGLRIHRTSARHRWYHVDTGQELCSGEELTPLNYDISQPIATPKGK